MAAPVVESPTITIKIGGVKELPPPNKDGSGFYDLYVKLHLGAQPKQKTEVMKKCLDPLFNQEFKYASWSKEEVLNVSLWDHKLTRNKFLGEILFAKSDLDYTGITKGLYELQESKQHPELDLPEGKLEIEIVDVNQQAEFERKMLEDMEEQRTLEAKEKADKDSRGIIKGALHTVAVRLPGGKLEHPTKENNEKYHHLFGIPDTEWLTEEYWCAMQRKHQPYPGILYLSPNYVCFHSHIVGMKEMKLVIPRGDMVRVEKDTMLKIPNAVSLTTYETEYFLHSFHLHLRNKAHETLEKIRQGVAKPTLPAGCQEGKEPVLNSYPDLEGAVDALDVTMSVSPRQFVAAFLVNAATFPFPDFYTAVGDEASDVTSWSHTPGPRLPMDTYTRTLKVRISDPMKPGGSIVTDRRHVFSISPGRDQLRLEMTHTCPEDPHADCFVVVESWSVSLVDDLAGRHDRYKAGTAMDAEWISTANKAEASSRVKVRAGIRFLKTPGTLKMIKEQMVKKIKAHLQTTVKKWHPLAEEALKNWARPEFAAAREPLADTGSGGDHGGADSIDSNGLPDETAEDDGEKNAPLCSDAWFRRLKYGCWGCCAKGKKATRREADAGDLELEPE